MLALIRTTPYEDHVQTLRFNIVPRQKGSETRCEHLKFEASKKKTINNKTERNGFTTFIRAEPFRLFLRNVPKPMWPIRNENSFKMIRNRNVWTSSKFFKVGGSRGSTWRRGSVAFIHITRFNTFLFLSVDLPQIIIMLHLRRRPKWVSIESYAFTIQTIFKSMIKKVCL